MSAAKRSKHHGNTGSAGGLALLTILMVGYVGTILFGTVWLRHRISVAANANRTLEIEMAEIVRKIDGINADIARAESPAQLLEQNVALRLNLVQPSEAQIVRVSDDVERRLATKRFNRLLAGPGPGARPLVEN